MSVVFGDGEQRVLFRDAVLDRSDPYAGGELFVEVHAAGLHATRRVFLFADSDLEGFFDAVAQAWRGWEGVRSWESPEHDLCIEAAFGSGGHVVFHVVVQDGTNGTWQAAVDVTVDAGEDATALGRAVRTLMNGPT